MPELLRSTRSSLLPTAVVLLCFAATGAVWAYDQYSQNKDLTNCAACHGDFRSNPYTEQAPDGGTWSNSLMSRHVDFLSGECDACHSSGRFPVYLNSANGGNGLDPISCVGCHGRPADRDNSNCVNNPPVRQPCGDGGGLRQHHWNVNRTISTPGGNVSTRVCGTCHNDADPASKTVADENSMPTFYSNPGTGHPDIPSDPCNLRPGFDENKDGASRGNDNDGDLLYDGNDPACSSGIATPGEVSGVVVTGLDTVAETITIDYDTTACSSLDNNLAIGALDQVGSYLYTDDACSIGNSGSYLLDYTSLPSSFYFLVVGNDNVVEGSYGLGLGIERPEAASGSCPEPQALTDRCD